jgi:DNA-binding transcriptional regulator WhiA
MNKIAKNYQNPFKKEEAVQKKKIFSIYVKYFERIIEILGEINTHDTQI